MKPVPLREDPIDLRPRWSHNAPAGPALTAALGAYLLSLVMIAAWALIAMFPRTVIVPERAGVQNATAAMEHALAQPRAPALQLEFGALQIGGATLVPRLHPDQGLLVLALLAGILGSFLHAAQSLAAYVGNQELRPSWILWYTLRPLVGGVVGLLFYFVVRAGLVSASAESVSPYGVVAFGAVAGWFSKQSTEKLSEVCETLFRARKFEDYRDKLPGTARWPRIRRVEPARLDPGNVPPDGALFVMVGESFAPGALVSANGELLPSRRLAEDRLEFRVPRSLVSEKISDLALVASNPDRTGHASEDGALRSEPFRLPVSRSLQSELPIAAVKPS